MTTELDSRDPLHWLSRILWPVGTTTIAPDRSDVHWWASPSADRPKILIPANSMAAAKTAVTRYHDGFSTSLRLRSLAAEVLMANRKLATLTLGRSGVRATPGVESSGVLSAIAELMGIDDLHVAVSLSTPKSNQKPVLQLMDGDGTCHGWAKVAWNERTEALVGNEAAWLQRPGTGGHRLPPLAMPTLLHDEVLCGRRVVITSGVSPSRRPRRSAADLPNLDVLRAVTALGITATVPITESPWWQSVEACLATANQRERRAITAAAASVADLRFQVGAWHGDLTPWNLMTTKDHVQLIDWEFAADGVPFGFDLCHFHTQVASEMKGCDAPAALARSARLSPQGLSELGIEAENRTAIWRLYLVELMRRLLALRANGYSTEHVHQGPAALNRLERSLGLNGAPLTNDIEHQPTDVPTGVPVS